MSLALCPWSSLQSHAVLLGYICCLNSSVCLGFCCLFHLSLPNSLFHPNFSIQPVSTVCCLGGLLFVVLQALSPPGSSVLLPSRLTTPEPAAWPQLRASNSFPGTLPLFHRLPSSTITLDWLSGQVQNSRFRVIYILSVNFGVWLRFLGVMFMKFLQVVVHINTVSFLWPSNSSVSEESACNAGDLSSIPGLERFPWRRKWQRNLQYSCPENPMERGTWQATVHGVSRVGHDLATKRWFHYK